MGQPEVDPPGVPGPEATQGVPRKRKQGPLVRGLACVAMVPLLGFIGQSGRTLWGQWNELRQDQADERGSAAVGYLNINPNVSYADRPSDWSHDEADASLLWAGWKDGENHWFRVGLGEMEGHLLSLPIGRDVIRAIDYPVYEQEGGLCWGRIPPEAPIAAYERDGLAIAFPMKVLEKVEVVNGHLGDRPVLVAYKPEGGDVSVYEANLDGRRVTLGHSGYFTSKHPILYDRKTQSLWAEEGDRLVALAGPRKGAGLKRIARLAVVAWGDWRDGHPQGQLLIGADRPHGLPAD